MAAEQVKQLMRRAGFPTPAVALAENDNMPNAYSFVPSPNRARRCSGAWHTPVRPLRHRSADALFARRASVVPLWWIGRIAWLN